MFMSIIDLLVVVGEMCITMVGSDSCIYLIKLLSQISKYSFDFNHIFVYVVIA